MVRSPLIAFEAPTLGSQKSTSNTCILVHFREAWNKHGDMPKVEAMKKYCEEVHKVIPSWDVRFEFLPLSDPFCCRLRY